MPLKFGHLPSKRLPRKAKLRQKFSDISTITDDQVPSSVDLRSEMVPVEDQSQIGSCTANGIAGAYEFLVKKGNGGEDVCVSRLFIYYNARVADAAENSGGDSGWSLTNAIDGLESAFGYGGVTDCGSTITNTIETLESIGVCLESTWPYDISQVNEKPSDEAYAEAPPYKISEAFQVNVDLTEMKKCLAQGFPFAFGLQIYSSYYNVQSDGIVSMPSDDDELLGGHTQLAVGYDDSTQSFIVRNSWGAGWGDNGYCYIPYAYMCDSNMASDAWTVKVLESVAIGNSQGNAGGDGGNADDGNGEDNGDGDDDGGQW